MGKNRFRAKAQKPAKVLCSQFLVFKAAEELSGNFVLYGRKEKDATIIRKFDIANTGR